MIVIFIIVFALVFIFSGVLIFGAPYLPTLKKQQVEALNLLNLKVGQKLIELGSGDGRILKEAGKRGLFAIGYEINPLLVIYSKLSCWNYRKIVHIYWRNFWHEDISDADGIYVFLLERFMPKLKMKIQNETINSVKVVSFTFPFPEKNISKKSGGLMLYTFAKNEAVSK